MKPDENLRNSMTKYDIHLRDYLQGMENLKDMVNSLKNINCETQGGLIETLSLQKVIGETSP